MCAVEIHACLLQTWRLAADQPCSPCVLRLLRHGRPAAGACRGSGWFSSSGPGRPEGSGPACSGRQPRSGRLLTGPGVSSAGLPAPLPSPEVPSPPPQAVHCSAPQQRHRLQRMSRRSLGPVGSFRESWCIHFLRLLGQALEARSRNRGACSVAPWEGWEGESAPGLSQPLWPRALLGPGSPSPP